MGKSVFNFFDGILCIPNISCLYKEKKYEH